MSSLRDNLKREAMEALEELGRDVLGGEKRPRLVAALTLIFAKERKDEFKAWVEEKKKNLPNTRPLSGF